MYKVALDFDNVIYDLNSIILQVLAKYGLSLEESLKVLKDWDMSAAPEAALKEINDIFTKFELMCDESYVMNTSKEWIAKHRDELDLYIVTSRLSEIAMQSRFFIEAVFDFPAHKIHVVARKTEVLEALGIDFLIDDGPHNIIPVMNHATITPILVKTAHTIYNHELAKDLEKINKKLVINNLGDLTYDVLRSIKEVSNGKKAVRFDGFRGFRFLDVFWNLVKRSLF